MTKSPLIDWFFEVVAKASSEWKRPRGYVVLNPWRMNALLWRAKYDYNVLQADDLLRGWPYRSGDTKVVETPFARVTVIANKSLERGEVQALGEVERIEELGFQIDRMYRAGFLSKERAKKILGAEYGSFARSEKPELETLIDELRE